MCCSLLAAQRSAVMAARSADSNTADSNKACKNMLSQQLLTVLFCCWQVRRLSHGNQQDQYLIGSYSTSPWSTSGSMMLALKPKAQDGKLSIGLLKASNTTEGDRMHHACF